MTFGFDTTADEAAAALAGNIKGRNVLVTGASPRSLGSECARVLAKHGAALVVLAGRNKAKLEETAAAIRAETPAANLRLLDLDLESLGSVRKAAAEVNGYEEPLHVLFNNSGIMATPFRVVGDGLESQFATNHIGHFLFTNLIINKLLEGSTPEQPSRVINVTSVGHVLGPVRFDDLNFQNGKVYNPWEGYGQSKTANILFSRALAARYPGRILSFAPHPGSIVTNLRDGVEEGAFAKLKEMGLIDLGKTRYKQLGNGASTHIVAGFDPSIAGSSGAYMEDCRVAEEACKEWAKDMEAAAKLWEVSEGIVGEKFGAEA
ncbi:NAD-P-binding protein [Hyaloraphidium curvatum]|nr:NAD-P-binding protein [Hyaloraphidium curvatum]